MEVRNLAHAAAGKNDDYLFVGGNSVALPKFGSLARVGAAFHDRMAHEGGRKAFGFKIGRLERQQGQQMIEKPGDFPGPSGPPRPDRGRHIMDERYSLTLEPLGDAKAEIRRVDSNQDRGPKPFNGVCGFTDALKNTRQPGQNLGRPHHRQIGHGEQAFQALLFHPGAANPGEGNTVLAFLFERRHKPRPQLVAGRLAGDNEYQGTGIGFQSVLRGFLFRLSALDVDTDDKQPGLVGGFDQGLPVEDERAPGFHRDAAKTGTGRRLDRCHANCRKIDTVFLTGLFHLDQNTPGTVQA